MLAFISSCGLIGIEGFPVDVEVNLAPSVPMFEIVGLPDASVKESRERVRAALRNSGYPFPAERLTINLAPADLKKEGPSYDLPIALGILTCTGLLRQDAVKDVCVFGELSLDGSVRAVRGALPMVISARERGVTRVMLPQANANEVSCIEGLDIYPVATLAEAARHFSGEGPIAPVQPVSYQSIISRRRYAEDFCHVKGQHKAKRALEIAAAGGHNVLMIGPPGSGKTLMARCMPTILPDMTFEEALETTRIHSAAGLMDGGTLLVERPFRTPHHTASSVSLIGGGTHATPGEISKAHNGVLFLDELPEYKRDVLEALRQPMEDGFVTITRVNAQSTYPSQFMLICSMNPCPCGNYGSRTQACRCSQMEIRRYLNRISGPLLDRIDLHIEIESIPPERIADDTLEESSAAVRARVEQARAVQRRRYAGRNIQCNARLDARSITEFCRMKPDAQKMLMKACDTMKLSNRAFTRILKVSRTIADMAGSDMIELSHVAEAVQYRTLDRKYWG